MRCAVPPRSACRRSSDPDSGQLIAYSLMGSYGRPRTIWMDGRAHPDDLAPHTWAGFSTGRWNRNTLVVATTHIKTGWLQRNGAPTSDLATMTEHFIRHGNHLHGRELRERPRVPVRAHGAHHQLRGEPRGQRERVGRLRARAGRGRDSRQPTRPRAALPAGADRTHRGVPPQRRRAGGGRTRRSGHALSRVRRACPLDPGRRAAGHHWRRPPRRRPRARCRRLPGRCAPRACRATCTCCPAPAATSRRRWATTACCWWIQGRGRSPTKCLRPCGSCPTSRFASSSTRTRIWTMSAATRRWPRPACAWAAAWWSPVLPAPAPRSWPTRACSPA